MAALKVGDEVPDFELPAVTGNIKSQFKLSDYRGKKNVVLAFYPADWTPVCASQLPALNTDLERFGAYDAQLVGISVDSIQSHTSLAEEGNRGVGLSFGKRFLSLMEKWLRSLECCAKAIPSRESTSARFLSSTRMASSRSARSIRLGRFPATMRSSRC